MEDKRLFRYHLWVPTHKKYDITAHSESEALSILDEYRDDEGRIHPLVIFSGEEHIEGLNIIIEQGEEVETCTHGHNLEEVMCSECQGCISCVDEGFEIGCGTCRK